MSTYVLCQVRQAKTPWYVRSLGLNLYSIEELCYFMVHNISLLNRDFFDDTLIDWLRTELGLKKLATELTRRKMSGYGIKDMAMPIFREIGYLDPEHTQAMENALEELENLSAPVRQKRIADTLAAHEKYGQALRTYREILEAPENKNLGIQFKGGLYHNMGVVHARMFQMEEACSCMKKAFEMLKTQGVIKSYLYCTWLKDGPEAFEELAAQLGADEATKQKILQEISGLKTQEVPKDIDKALAEWVEAYHRFTEA